MVVIHLYRRYIVWQAHIMVLFFSKYVHQIRFSKTISALINSLNKTHTVVHLLLIDIHEAPKKERPGFEELYLVREAPSESRRTHLTFKWQRFIFILKSTNAQPSDSTPKRKTVSGAKETSYDTNGLWGHQTWRLLIFFSGGEICTNRLYRATSIDCNKKSIVNMVTPNTTIRGSITINEF